MQLPKWLRDFSGNKGCSYQTDAIETQGGQTRPVA